MSRVRSLPWLLSWLLLSAAAPATAAEWHEAYRDGVNALAQGDAMRAVTLIEYAAGQRPRPGRNVVTYGTNVEARYYPYLRLAEAYLQVHDLAGARSAIRRSEKWALEPADERRRLAAQAEELAARLAPPAAVPSPPPAPASPQPAPDTARSIPVETPEPDQGTHAGHAPERVGTVAAPPMARATPEPRAAPPSPARHAAPVEAPGPAPDEAPAPTSCSIDIVSQPPGATVYLDDELIGTTDPEWGRLIKSGIASGRHRVRLSLPGHRDVIDEVELGVGSSREIRRRLEPEEAPADRRPLIFGAVAVLLIALTVWALRRSRGEATSSRLHPRFLDTSPRAAPATPAGFGSPGVRREADGAEYFGDYRLVEPLGRGGMASVYKAERRGEVSALKRPLPAFLDEPEFLERFQREAEIGRTLYHPNIVRILERGKVEQVPYFTMELVPGETLQAHLHHMGALDPLLATGIVVQVAEALDYAHLKGVVHRDLKPSNVMVLEDGAAKVMDYGIARARRFEGMTMTGAFLGSPEYVAPEAIEGKLIDARSDLYSLGVIFYETLTGRRPFTSDTPFAVLRKHLTEAPPPPSQLVPDLPTELERIVLRLLDKDADKRHSGAEELVRELRDFLNRAA